MYESSDSHFFRTIMLIQSGPDAFDKSKLVIALLTNLSYMNIMQFQISPWRKSGKEIPDSSRCKFLEKFLLQVVLLYQKQKTTSCLY